MHNNTLSCDQKGLYIHGRHICYTSVINIENNTFTYNEQIGLDIDLYVEKTPEVTVSGNHFYGGTAFAMSLRAHQPVHLKITRNTFDKGMQGIYLLLKSFNGTNDALNIENNAFQNFESWRKDRNVIRMLTSLYTPTSLINDNSFINNTLHSVIYIEGTASVSVLDNIFDNPGSTYDLEIFTARQGGDTMYAKRNWWGSDVRFEIGRRIYDHNDDDALVAVDFEPFRTTPDGDSFSSFARSLVRGDGVIGGEITENTLLRAGESPFTAVESIVVPRGLQLIIEAGTVIDFQNDHHKIFVQGTL